MNVQGSYNLSQDSSFSVDEDILIKKLLLSHDPHGCRLDSQQLLRAIENIMCCATSSEDSGLQLNKISDTEISGILEPIGQQISKISHEIFCKQSIEMDLHERAMLLLESLENNKWDAKLVLILAAFATTYGEFWLVMQLYPKNPLAVSVAILKQLPTDVSKLRPQFRALSLLIKTLVDVSKCVIEFEALPISEVEIVSEAEKKTINETKFRVYLAAYWVTRSSLACSRQIKDLIAMKLSEQVFEFDNNCRMGALEFKPKMNQKLSKLFQETHSDNQEVLRIMFALKDDLPLKHCPSQAKCGLSELKDKLVIVLISKPELLSLEELFFLVQQTDKKTDSDEKFEIVWVPISVHETWTDSEERSFDFLSNSLPWYTIRQPWQLSSAVINYIKQDWKYKQEPLMVVLNSQGNVTHPNALNMMCVWGSRAYPFTMSREKQLWEEENWSLNLIIDGIDPLLSKWVMEDKQICIYGSTNLNWIRKFNSKVKVIKSKGLQLETVYVGKRNPDEQVRNILTTITEEMHSSLFSFTKIHFFWLRMESVRKSKLSLRTTESDHDPILENVSRLFLEMGENNMGWVLIGRGSSPDIITLEDENVMEFLDKFKEWKVKSAIDEQILGGPCSHSDIVPFDAKLISSTVICQKCKRVMNNFVIFE
ncbi:hypothetical protein ACFE04_022826 [Oxalis oulophora]